MRQLVTITSLLGWFIIFASVTDLFEALLMFLLFGVLPGRHNQLSANQMLGIYVLATAFIAAYALRGRVAPLVRHVSLTRPTRSNAS